MTDKQLIKLAASVTKFRKLGENSAGDVGCALLSEKDKVYLGVCMDIRSSLGFCAEHNAIGSMITNGESRIKKIVAVWRDKKKKIYILHPCGRCRELMLQVNKRNLGTDVILGENKISKLKDLLPYKDDFSKVK